MSVIIKATLGTCCFTWPLPLIDYIFLKTYKAGTFCGRVEGWFICVCVCFFFFEKHSSVKLPVRTGKHAGVITSLDLIRKTSQNRFSWELAIHREKKDQLSDKHVIVCFVFFFFLPSHVPFAGDGIRPVGSEGVFIYSEKYLTLKSSQKNPTNR